MVRLLALAFAMVLGLAAAPAGARHADRAPWCCEENEIAGPACSQEPPGECLRAGGTPGLGECVGEQCAVPLPWCCERNGFPGPFCSTDAPARCLREGGTPAAGVCDPAGGRCLAPF